MTIDELTALAKKLIEDGTTKDDIFAFLDEKAAHNPDLTSAVGTVKVWLATLLDQGNITDTFTKGLAEVLILLKNKVGPVSDAPEIGIV